MAATRRGAWGTGGHVALGLVAGLCIRGIHRRGRRLAAISISRFLRNTGAIHLGRGRPANVANFLGRIREREIGRNLNCPGERFGITTHKDNAIFRTLRGHVGRGLEAAACADKST